ncbi:hypothetical protein E2C01_016569 [Portunus trituberculatus]|uniref:Uncharacterized protein n=1 Tax=Portunus trituberculatus TaxID=210409 RepID=A0A5B7DQW2_PORTR|nr:hypothetical protein [Portunus trituberculatus]
MTEYPHLTVAHSNAQTHPLAQNVAPPPVALVKEHFFTRTKDIYWHVAPKDRFGVIADQNRDRRRRFAQIGPALIVFIPVVPYTLVFTTEITESSNSILGPNNLRHEPIECNVNKDTNQYWWQDDDRWRLSRYLATNY